MPPLPNPRISAADRPKPKAPPKKASAGKSNASEAKATGKGDSSIGSATKAPPGRRTPTNAKLEDKISRFYMMIGTVMRPFGRWYPPLTEIGDSVKEFSDEAAEAWMELAEENSEVKKMLEQWTSASIYGNIIGVHFAMFMAAAPKPMQQMASGDPIEMMRAMGASDEEIAIALRAAGMEAGGPGDTIRSDRAEEKVPTLEQIMAEQRAQADIDLNAAMNHSNGENQSGIVTPDQLGIIRDGQENSTEIPLSGPPRGI